RDPIKGGEAAMATFLGIVGGSVAPTVGLNAYLGMVVGAALGFGLMHWANRPLRLRGRTPPSAIFARPSVADLSGPRIQKLPNPKVGAAYFVLRLQGKEVHVIYGKRSESRLVRLISKNIVPLIQADREDWHFLVDDYRAKFDFPELTRAT